MYKGNRNPGIQDGNYEINIPLKGDMVDAEAIDLDVTITDDGNNTCQHNMSALGSGEVKDEEIEGHCRARAIRTHGAASISPNRGTTFTVEISAVGDDGEDYEVHSALSVDSTFSDNLGIGINNATDPVPQAWGLVFNSFTGEIAPGGGASPMPTVEIPNDPNLMGKTFHLVLAIKDGAGEITNAGHVLTVTIQ